MAVVRMYIDKFKGVVVINDDHPLAVAQRAKNAAREAAPATDTPSASVPAVSTVPASTTPRPRRLRRAPAAENPSAVDSPPTG